MIVIKYKKMIVMIIDSGDERNVTTMTMTMMAGMMMAVMSTFSVDWGIPRNRNKDGGDQGGKTNCC